MTLSELAAYAEEKYHMKEEHKWNDFTGYSVLADPDTNKWVALLMRQWDYETGTELQKCDIKCGRQIMRETDAPYVGNSFRMKGNKWVGVLIGEETDRETVFRLFDEAVRAGRSGAYTVVLERTDQNDGDGKISRDSLLPLEAMRGNYDRRRFQKKEEEAEREEKSKILLTGPAGETEIPFSRGGVNPTARAFDRNPGNVRIPQRILEMMQLYEYGTNSFENKCRNFYRQGKFMEDYEDDAPWNSEFKRYFTTYHDLNLNQLRGYFAWRTRVRRGEFFPITASLAYMYIYELLNMIGTACPEESLRRMRDFEAGYLDSGIGDSAMRENLNRWIMEFAVLSGVSHKEVLSFIDPALLERDRKLMILRNPQNYSDEEVYQALNSLSGGKTGNSPVIRREPGRGKHLFAGIWRYMTEHYNDDGWDLFTACFGKLRRYPWHPLANAVYLDQKRRDDTEYRVTDCRKYVFGNGEWSEIRYDELYFDKYRVHAIAHEADRQLRRYLKTGSYLKEKQEEKWIAPFVEAVIEEDREAQIEAAKPKITIDLSGLDKIRRDAQITRDSLLTEEEMREQADRPVIMPLSVPEPEADEIPAAEEEKAVTIEIPFLEGMHAKILFSLMRGKTVAQLIRQNHLMPSVVTDSINEAMFDEIGDNILECDGDEITLVEDYREDLEEILGINT